MFEAIQEYIHDLTNTIITKDCSFEFLDLDVEQKAKFEKWIYKKFGRCIDIDEYKDINELIKELR